MKIVEKKNIRLGARSDYQNHNGAIYGQDYLIDLVLEKEAPDYNYEIVSIEHTSRTEATIPTANFKYFCIDCGKPIRQKSTRCQECHYKFVHPVDIPQREKLKEMIRKMPFTEIAKKYGRTDNTIRKWCDKYNLPRRKKDIEEFSDEDWLNI